MDRVATMIFFTLVRLSRSPKDDLIADAYRAHLLGILEAQDLKADIRPGTYGVRAR